MSAPDAQGVPRPPGDGHAVGQVVAAGSAGGSIYDLGYRGYTGPRLGRRHAVASLIRQSFRQAWGVGRGGRAKVVPIVLGGIATVPAVVALGFLALACQLGGVNVEGISPIRYETYYPLIAQVVFLFAAAQAPELLGRDLRHRVLALYFSRAIEREDYALGKLVALAGAMLVLILFRRALVLLGRPLLSAVRPGAPRPSHASLRSLARRCSRPGSSVPSGWPSPAGRPGARTRPSRSSRSSSCRSSPSRPSTA